MNFFFLFLFFWFYEEEEEGRGWTRMREGIAFLWEMRE